MKYCIHCGSEMSDEAEFCEKCGKAVKKVSGEKATKKPLIIGCSIGIVLVSIIVVSLFATGVFGGKNEAVQTNVDAKLNSASSHVAPEEERKSPERGKDWDYKVVAVRDCPEDFLKELEEKKVNEFQMTYMDGEYLYIALGYGEQVTGGFSIAVRGLYEMGDKLCFEVELLGPRKDEVVKEKASYPFIIIKTEKTDRKVLFDYR